MAKNKFPNLGTPKQGKVRDIYDLGKYLLIVTTDRISAFDVVMNEPVPGKGKILNQMSALWFKKLAPIIRNHFVSIDTKKFPEKCQPYAKELAGRSMLVLKCAPIMVEVVVRRYLSGSGWKKYQQGKPICGLTLPPGLKESDRLPEPIFTPTTKAATGHDEEITFQDMIDSLGPALAKKIRDISIKLYLEGAKYAEQKGIIIADTKFEFGMLENELILTDELLTPDSSRFWPKDLYKPGGPQPSFDKQFLRDYLKKEIKWDEKPPPPPIPAHIIDATNERYEEALKRLFY
jgi:phosphoribosylaminoimidazole-succinocarboxamide synthase